MDTELAQCEEALRQSETAYSALLQQARAIQGQVSYTQQQPQATPADLAMVSRAGEQKLLEKQAALPELERRVAAVDERK